MGLVYIQSQTQKNSHEILNFCQSINEDAMIESNYCVFEVDSAQRIQLKLTLETFQEDLQDLLICVEGFDNKLIMNCALDLARIHSLGTYTDVAELLIDSVMFMDNQLLSFLNDLFMSLKPELIETAKMYLWAGSNAKLAAEALYLHRNTFNYRMKKFEEKSAINLTETNHAFLFRIWLDLQK